MGTELQAGADTRPGVTGHLDRAFRQAKNERAGKNKPISMTESLRVENAFETVKSLGTDKPLRAPGTETSGPATLETLGLLTTRPGQRHAATREDFTHLGQYLSHQPFKEALETHFKQLGLSDADIKALFIELANPNSE